MTTAELLNRVYNQLRDFATPYLWADEEIVVYANEAIKRLFTLVPDMVLDSTTASVCDLTMVAGTRTYALSELVLDVKSVRLALQTAPLRKIGFSKMNLLYPTWRTMANGTPKYYCQNAVTGSVVILPPPSGSDTANMTISRLPLTELSVVSPTAEIGFTERYHTDLVPWIVHLCLSKRDVETFRPDAAEQHRQMFEKRCEEIRIELDNMRSSRITQAVPSHGMMSRMPSNA